MSETPEDKLPESAPAPAAALHAEIAALQDKMQRALADLDRHVAEKAEILGIADAVSRERDQLRVQLAGLARERDHLLAEASKIKDHLGEAASRAEAAALEAARYAKDLADERSADSLQVIWGVVQKETKAGLAFLRSKIPEGHPAQKWLDVTVDLATEVGCIAAQSLSALLKWAIPQAKALFAKLMSEAEQRLAKK
jgi:hypothetical protein